MELANGLKNIGYFHLSPNKTEATILNEKRNRKNIGFKLEEKRIVDNKTAGYPDIILNDGVTFKIHIRKIVTKVEERVGSLVRILLNKRAACSSALHNMVLQEDFN